jgi:tRNA threonylcarbamoyladenosine dehydratase
MPYQGPRRHTFSDPEFYDDNRTRYSNSNERRSERGKNKESMSSWLQKQAGSHNVQLAAAAVVSGVAVAAGIFGFQALRRQEAVDQLKASIPEIDDRHRAEVLTEFGTAGSLPALSKEDLRSAALARRAQQGDYDDDLILEQLARNRVFLTDEGLQKLRSSFVVVVGCGGVGSHATTSLARSGVAKIRLIDFDQVTLSSLNRHALATLADVGTPKVHCIRRRLEQIVPWVHFDCRNELFGANVADKLLAPWTDKGLDGQKPDYVIDCIDNIDSKVELLHYCHKNSIRVISSMGAGCKSDPTRITVADISASMEDPLSRSTRRRLRILGVNSGIPVVFSTEKPGSGKASLLPLSEEEFAKGKVGELGVLPDFRVRILPVLGTMPAMFGYTIANHVICDITGYPIDYSLAAKNNKLIDNVSTQLQVTIERLVRAEEHKLIDGLRIPLSKEEVAFVVDEIWRGRSVVSGMPTRLALVPWLRPAQGFKLDPQWEREGQRFIGLDWRNLVCMTKEEAVRHEREVLLGGRAVDELYDEKVLQLIAARLKEAEIYERFR